MKLKLNQAVCNISRFFSESKIIDFRSLIILLLLSTCIMTNAQNSAHFIALDSNGNLYDVNPATCSNVQLNICSNILSPLSIALSGNILYVVDNKGKLYKQTYDSTANCTLIGTFPSAAISSTYASGYYGLTVDANGIVYAATGGNIDTYTPNTNSFASLNGTLPTKWKIGGDLILYGGQLFMACKNLDLIKINISNIANSTTQLSFPASSQIFGLASVSVPCANNQAYAIDSVSSSSTNILTLNMTTGAVVASCSLPFKVYDTASLAESGSYVAPLAPTVLVTQPSCSSNTATLTVSPTLTGYTYSIDGINFTNTTGIFSGILAGTNYSIKAKDALGCISNPTTGTVNSIPAPITPTFNAIATVCQNAIAPSLPTNSTNVPPISGIWNSTINTANTGTTIYNFTPNAGQCGIPTTLSVTVENCGFGTFASAGWLNNCATPSGQFYNITGTGANLINPSSPQGSFMTNMGSFVKDSGSLIFKGGEIKTFKNTLGNVCGAKMFYNIHLQSAPAGTFTPITLNFFSDCVSGAFQNGGGPCNPRDQKWQTTNNPVDLTTLPQGNYVLEVYYTVSGSSVSTSGCNDTVTLNNGGINYLSSFSINASSYSSTNPTTCGGSEGTITITGLTASTVYALTYNNGANTIGPLNLTSNSNETIVVTGLSAGTYSNFSLAFNACSSVNSTPIILVNPVLNSTITKTDNTVCQSITVPCNGTATTLPSDGSGSYSYLWNDTLAQTTATATGLCAGNYCVKVTDLVSLCTIDKCITVGDAAILPVFNSLSIAAPSICAGGTAEFLLAGTANAILTYTINGGTVQLVTLDASGNATVKVNGATTDTTILVSNINLGTCNVILNDTQTVTISAVADAGTLSGNQSICSNGTSTFSSTIPNGIWNSTDSTIATVDNNGLITAIKAGTTAITYTVLGTGSCPDAIATRTITITAAPNAGILSGNQTICSNGTSNFTSTQTGGSWTSSDTAIATIDNTGLITAVSAGTSTITYTVLGTGGCSDATVTRTVTITTAPNAGVLSGNQTICSNGTTTFTSSQPTGTWSSSNTGIATVDNNGQITAVTAGTATITYTVLGSGGCPDAKATRTITITAAPNAGVLSGNQAICINGTSSFTSTQTGGTWSSSDTTIATINSSGAITPISVGTATITYTVTGTGGCTDAIATRIITISGLANAGIISGIDTICSNGITTFSSTQPNGTWTSSETSIASINSSGIISGISSGTSIISYTVIGTGGCPNAVTTKNVSVSNPLVSITADCIDANYTLTAITNETNPTFTWYKGTTALSETSNTLVVKAVDNYKVVINSNGCSAEATENVTFFYCEIPRGISPNGDNKNDFFDLSNLHVSKLEIFNRYGVKVYSKSNYKKEWNGTTDSGQELPDATYYYVIEFESGKTKTGWVFINK